MEHDELTLIENHNSLNAETLYFLRSMVARYPYYQTARLLLVENMLNNHCDLDVELRKTSLYAADRSVLFYMLERDKYRIVPLADAAVKPKRSKVTETSDMTDRTSDLIDNFLETMPDEQPHRRLTLADATTDYAAYLAQQDDETPAQSYKARAKSRKADGSVAEKPVRDRKATKNTVEKVTTPAENVHDIPQDDFHDDNMSANSQYDLKNESEEDYFTETLAKIYIKQGKYLRAIEIMRKLRADYPKKSSYFADQIRFLEKAVINNNNKK